MIAQMLRVGNPRFTGAPECVRKAQIPKFNPQRKSKFQGSSPVPIMTVTAQKPGPLQDQPARSLKFGFWSFLESGPLDFEF
jgi:hypothetical protein